jgi:hypothetical protein
MLIYSRSLADSEGIIGFCIFAFESVTSLETAYSPAQCPQSKAGSLRLLSRNELKSLLVQALVQLLFPFGITITGLSSFKRTAADSACISLQFTIYRTQPLLLKFPILYFENCSGCELTSRTLIFLRYSSPWV